MASLKDEKMMKNLVVLLACLGLVVQLSGCSLFSSDKKSGEEVAADIDSADLEKLEGDDSLSSAAVDHSASDSLPEDALGETSAAPATTADTAAPPPADIAAAPVDMPPDTGAHDALPADPFSDNSSSASNELPPPPMDSSTSSTTVVDSGVTSTPDTVPMVESTTKTTTKTTSSFSSSSESSFSEPKKPSAPLQKVATAPWQVGKTWYNTVYFARPGDTLSSISQMIYGSNKVAERSEEHTSELQSH